MAITIEKICGVKTSSAKARCGTLPRKRFYWIDGSAPAIYRLDPKTNDIKSWKDAETHRLLRIACRRRRRCSRSLMDSTCSISHRVLPNRLAIRSRKPGDNLQRWQDRCAR